MLQDIEALISSAIEGNEKAQRELYLQYRSLWYSQCLRYGKNRYEADDIFQEGLIQVYRDLHQYDTKRGKFSTWSGRIFTHSALRYLKKNAPYGMMDEPTNENMGVEENSILTELHAKELTEMLQKLPVGYRMVFNLYVIEGYKHHEIAEKLNISEGTSKSQLFKAKKMLKKTLEAALAESQTI